MKEKNGSGMTFKYRELDGFANHNPDETSGPLFSPPQSHVNPLHDVNVLMTNVNVKEWTVISAMG